jgi:hypothetical protein
MTKKAILFLFLAGCLAGSAWSETSVGTITYVSGEVTVTRDGQALTAGQVRIGKPVEDYDLIRTGGRGLMELTVKTPRNESIQLKVRKNTAFTVEMGKLSNGKSSATFQMMSGTLACKVDRLSGSEVHIKTKTAAMGVRGTDFEVTTTPTEDLLVTCDEGEVVCRRDNGEEESVKPGNVIEFLADEGKFNNLPVTRAELEKYREAWFVKRIEVFRAVAPKVVKGLSAAFDRSYNALVKSYNTLKRSGRIIDKWKREDRSGRIGSLRELLREKKQIIGALFRIKISLFAFEHVYYRLLELETYVDEGFGADDPAVKKFYRDLAGKKRTIEAMLADVTYIFKLYAKRNEGSFPADMMGTDDDNFFDDDMKNGVDDSKNLKNLLD